MKKLFLFSTVTQLLFFTVMLQGGWAQRDTLPFKIVGEKDIPKISNAEAAIREFLWTKSDINLKDKTLSEIAASISQEFKIKCQVDVVALTNDGILVDQKLDWREKNATLGKSLHRLLESRGLAFGIKSDALIVTTTLEAEALISTELYEVGDILVSGKAQRVEVVRRGVTSSSFEFQQLVDLIESICSPDSWEYQGGPGYTQPAELNGKQFLIISQKERVHMEITDFLTKLRKAAGIKKEAKHQGLDLKKPILRIYPLRQELKSPAEDYVTLVKQVIEQDWEAEGTSIKAIANTLVVRQPPELQAKILGMLTDLDVLSSPKPIPDERIENFGGGFFNIETPERALRIEKPSVISSGAIIRETSLN